MLYVKGLKCYTILTETFVMCTCLLHWTMAGIKHLELMSRP